MKEFCQEVRISSNRRRVSLNYFILLVVFFMMVGCTDLQMETEFSSSIVELPVSITSPINGSSTSYMSQFVNGECLSSLRVELSGDFRSSPQSQICIGGAYSFNVHLTAGDGGKSFKALQYSIKGIESGEDNIFIDLDTQKPVISITIPVAGDVVDSGNEGSFLVEGFCSESGQIITFSHGVGGTNCSGGSFSTTINMTSVISGNFNLKALISDSAGNSGESASVNLLRAASLSIAITSPSNGDYVNLINENTFAVSGTCNEVGRAVTFSHGVGAVNCDGTNFSTTLNMSGVAEGVFNLTASIDDGFGNSTTSLAVSLEKDSVAPASPTIASPVDGSTSGNVAQTLSGSCVTGNTVNVSGDFTPSPQNQVCASGSYSFNISLTSGDGVKNIVANQTDAAGNTSANQTSTITLDQTAPLIAITTPSNGDYVNVSNQNSFAVNGTCNEAGRAVTFSHGVGAVNCDGTNFSTTLNMSGVAEGVFNLTASIDDGSGNSTTSLAVSLEKDSVAPTSPTIASPVDGSTSGNAAQTLSGSCVTGNTVNVSGDFTPSPQNQVCASGSYSFNISLTAGDGVKNIVANQTDAAGNTSANQTSTITLDQTAPLIAITTPSNGDYVNVSNQNSFAVNGTCNEAGRAVTFSHGVGAVNCDGANFNTTLDMSGVAEGAFNLTASIDDGFGNSKTSLAVSLTKDSLAPTLSIGTPNVGTVDFFTSVDFVITYSGATTVSLNPSGVNITGASTDCSAAVANGTTATPTVTISGCSAASGSIQISIDAGTATDVAGNASLASALSAAVLVSNIPQGDPFVSRWTFTAGKSFTIPLKSGLNYNFTVDWGDASPASTVTSYSDVDKTHVYTAGTYTMTITGVCEGFQNSGVFKNDLIEVVDLGVVNWRDLSRAFVQNTNLVNVSGGDVSQVTDMSAMFSGATLADPDTSGWNTSQVTNMGGVFARATSADPDVSGWKTSQVTDMSVMFSGATLADPDTSGWNTSQVTNMNSMFYLAAAANPDTSGRADALKLAYF